MSTPTPLHDAASANEAIRRFVAGRRVWTPTDLAELDRLRAVWQRAVEREEKQAQAVEERETHPPEPLRPGVIPAA
ncbi:hypothetical protein [Streptomyces sp. NPDC005438]|uniref:hypothetical protein n=1 Tax=Streptomyces sp. NPDC005438 TaxID=3156880 RepID=UPI0033B90339